MAEDFRNRQTQSEEDLEFPTGAIDPLAELAAELTVCLMIVEAGQGGFCDWCTCQLKFHVPVEEDGECEHCMCPELHKTVKKDLTYMPTTDKYSKTTFGADIRQYTCDTYDREKEARNALRELSD